MNDTFLTIFDNKISRTLTITVCTLVLNYILNLCCHNVYVVIIQGFSN